MFLPILRLTLQYFALQPTSLTLRIVGKQDRQQWKWVRPMLPIRPIQLAQLPQQDSDRPAVRDDVMHRQQQHMLLVADLQQSPADQRARAQVKSLVGLLTCFALDFRGSVPRASRPYLPQIPLSQREFARSPDHLDRLTLLLAECRAQHLVTLDDRIQRRTQRRSIQHPMQPYRPVDVVRPATSYQLIEEPQPFLCPRQ